MDKLLNAEVIRAAASSSLGTLSLMCLILGVIAMAFFRNAPVRAKIIVFVLLLIGVAGFGYAISNQQSPTATPQATRQFFVGRWQVEQKIGGIEGSTFVDYFDDGNFSGREETFQGEQGGRTKVSGTWDFVKLADNQFRLTLHSANGNQWQGTFRIVDHDRIHNMDDNYDAVRVPK